MTGIVLAGGLSRRMGRDKALLDVGGQPLIQRVVQALEGVLSQLIVVTNDPAAYAFLGLGMVSDLIPGRGALGGLHTGLFYAPTPHAFVVACDMPFLSPPLIRHLATRATRWDVIVPRVAGHLEPLHAIYSRRCLKPIEGLLETGGRKIIDLYPKVRVREVPETEIRTLDPHLLSFRNVNTPEELKEIREIAVGGRGTA